MCSTIYPNPVFFEEATRCTEVGGALVMIEPWVTPWSTLIYTKVHHEPYQPDSPAWDFPQKGPLSGANGALPCITFSRDLQRSQTEYPGWEIQEITLHTPFRYLISGGVSKRNFAPNWSFDIWTYIEENVVPLQFWAMFAHITLIRV